MKDTTKTTQKRKAIIIVLIAFALLLTVGSLAYWAATVAGGNDATGEVINIGEGNTISMDVNASKTSGVQTDKLIPQTITPSVGETTELVLEYSLLWKGTTPGDENGSNGATSTYTVVITDVKIDGNATLGTAYAVVTIKTNGTGNITSGTATAGIEISVKLIEPVDETDYLLVALKDITFTLTFTVA